jgi:hypothetical protein
MPGLSPADVAPQTAGRRRSGASVKTLKRVLKKAGLKVSGKKAALTRRAKKARLMRGGMAKPVEEVAKVGGEEMDGARRRKSRGSKKFLGVF